MRNEKNAKLSHVALLNAIVIVYAVAGASLVQAQCEFAVLSPDPSYAVRYGGYPVSIWGNTIIAGDEDDQEKAEDAGAAYVFRFDGSDWSKEQKLMASDGGVAQRFGSSVAVFGDTAMVGSPFNFGVPKTGAAYRFEFDGAAWSEQQKLESSDGETGDRFGISVAMTSETGLVGLYSPYVRRKGKGYLFGPDPALPEQWVEQGYLQAAAYPGYNFGKVVALYDETAVLTGRTPPSSGELHVFDLADCNENGVCDSIVTMTTATASRTSASRSRAISMGTRTSTAATSTSSKPASPARRSR